MLRKSGELILTARTPFAAAELFGFLAARAIPGVEEVADGAFRRTTADGGVVALGVRGPAITLRTTAAEPGIEARAARLLDLSADPATIDAALAADPLLAPLVARRPGLRVPGVWDAFELVVRAVVGQQVSVAAASTLAGRLVRAAGTPLDAPDGSLTHAFPAPAALASADVDRIGMPRRRAATLRAVGAAVASGDVDLDGPPAEAADALLALPGIGPWTVAYVAMRAFRDPDALPATDLGLRRAFEAVGLAGDERSIRRRAERWRPWRSYAVLHLWTSLGDRTLRP
jgi:AraC family transcriptional regulator of adaptative response / DNA-3-methyladenine glycosylase II